MEHIDPVLSDDYEYLQELLTGFGAYRFSEDVQRRMDALGLSAVSLGKRCQVSHTIVDRWRTGRARPNGKERLKELGMALGMDEGELNTFLLLNGYPRLYVKNPLDSAARLLLLEGAGAPDIVSLYRQLTARLGLDALTSSGQAEPLSSALMSAELRQAAQRGSVSGWFQRFRGQFAGDGKKQPADLRLGRFLLLYLGETSIRALSVEGELPTALRTLLYPLLSGRGVTVRFLREKLIAFGLFANMTEEEIDAMLTCARLRPLTETASALDVALLGALRCAHQRYPYYEQENLNRILRRLDPPQDDYEALLLEQYRTRSAAAARLCAYYDAHPKTAAEQDFEQRYTSYADRGVMDYVRDLLLLLTEQGLLTEGESRAFTDLIRRNEMGESIWN